MIEQVDAGVQLVGYLGGACCQVFAVELQRAVIYNPDRLRFVLLSSLTILLLVWHFQNLFAGLSVLGMIYWNPICFSTHY